MKKLKKIQINPDKLMKNVELMTLRGGYDGCDYYCVVREYYQGPVWLEGYCCLSSAEACVQELASQYNLDTTCWHN